MSAVKKIIRRDEQVVEEVAHEDVDNGSKVTMTISELEEIMRTTIAYNADLFQIQECVLTNGDPKVGYLIGSEDGTQINLNDVHKLITRIGTKFNNIKSHIKTATKEGKKKSTRTPTLNYVSKTFVDFLINLNFGNGYAMAFAKKLNFKEQAKRVDQVRAKQFERAADLARLDGNVVEDRKFIEKELKDDYDLYKENYITNYVFTYGEESFENHVFNATGKFDVNKYSVRENLTLLFSKNITTTNHLLKLWHLYIRVNRFSSGVRFLMDEELDNFLNREYDWVFSDEKGEIDFSKDDGFDNQSIGTSLKKSEIRAGGSMGTVGDKRNKIQGVTIMDHARHYTNIDQVGKMDISKAIGVESDGTKIRDTEKFKDVVTEDGILLAYIMVFINNWIIPDPFFVEGGFAELLDERNIELFKDEDKYLSEVIEGVKLADEYGKRMDKFKLSEEEKAKAKAEGSPKKAVVKKETKRPVVLRY